MAEARIAVELAKYFDMIHVDGARSGRYPLLNEGIDKYVYTALQAEERAYGWSSSSRKLGWFLLNPSAEYLSGGPTKAEFLAHGNPTVLNYWKSSHYYGANVTVAKGERWDKVIGPFMFYVNEGSDHAAMVDDAKRQLREEERKWPYAWVDAEGYSPPARRSSVVGRLALSDPSQSNRYKGTLTVGLSRAPYSIETSQGDKRAIEWQNDGKFYQFWSQNSDPEGRFEVADVAPGTYTLYAFAEGVLGEFSKADIVVNDRGGTFDLGRLEWKPVRYGRPLWEIGIADRSGKEFRHGDRYFEPGVQLRYPEQFPNNVRYSIASSDSARDWFFAHVPTATTESKAEIRPFSGVTGSGKATPYTIAFDLPEKTRGIATLRLAITTTSTPTLGVAVNGQQLEAIRMAPLDNSLTRHQMYGRWFETGLSFDASLLKNGENTLTLTVPAGSLNAGIVYDYLRLELDESADAPRFEPTISALATRSAPPSSVAGPTYRIHTALDDVNSGLPAFEVNGIRFIEQKNSGGHRAIYLQRGEEPPRLVVGPDAFANGVLSQWRPSPDGSKIAFIVADGPQSDAWRRILVWDVATRRRLPDEIPWVKESSLAWVPDSSGFYYSKYRDPSPDPEVQRFNVVQEVFFHSLGQDRRSDPRVYASDRGSMVHYAEVSDDGRWVVVNGSVNGNGRAEIVLIDRTQKAGGPFKAIRTMRDSWQFAGSKGPLLYFVTSEGAPRRRVVALDTASFTTRIVEVIPERAETLQAARVAGDEVLLSYSKADATRIEKAKL